MKKQKTMVLLLLLLMITPCLRAQKKELSQARSYIKSGKDFDKAEKLMTDLLKKDSANRTNEKIYLTWFQAVTEQYKAANEKLYLKQKYDTAAFFNLTRRLYSIAETLDTLDARPDEKGRVKIRYREDHAEMLDQLRPNLYFGGTYFLRKEELQPPTISSKRIWMLPVSRSLPAMTIRRRTRGCRKQPIGLLMLGIRCRMP